MKSKVIAIGILRAVGIILGAAILLWLLYTIKSVIAYLIISAVLSLIGRPSVRFLRSKLKMNSTGAAIVTILLLIIIICGIIALFIPVIIDQSHHLSQINFDDLRANGNRIFDELAKYLNIDKTTMIKGFQDADIVSEFDFSVIPSFLNDLLGNMGDGFIGLFAVIFITFFFLKDNKLVTQGILVFAPKGKERRSMRVFEKIKYLLSRYFVGLSIQVFVMFILYAIILLSFGIKNALAIALFCAVLNLVPFIGPLVGGFVMLLLATTSYIDMDFRTVILPKLLFISICYVIAQLLDNFVVQPFVFGTSVKSHPLEIFLAIIICGLLFGVVGMIIAVPAYTALKVISGEFLSQYKIVKKLTKNF